ncbi:MAG: retroviral-like aspartic protease family protein [Bacilli bacterium]
MTETTIQGTIAQDAFQFNLTLGYQGSTMASSFILDTGAFELTLSEYTAAALNLPNLGTLTIQGVTGAATAYQSEVDLQIGGQTYDHVACIVDPSLANTQLFGLRFFIDKQLQLTLNPAAQTLTIAAASSTAQPTPTTPSQTEYTVEFTDKASADAFVQWAMKHGWNTKAIAVTG